MFKKNIKNPSSIKSINFLCLIRIALQFPLFVINQRLYGGWGSSDETAKTEAPCSASVAGSISVHACSKVMGALIVQPIPSILTKT